MLLGATNIVAIQPPKCPPTGTPTARANILKQDEYSTAQLQLLQPYSGYS